MVYTLKEGVNKPEAIEIIRNALEPLVGVIPGLTHMEIRATYQGGMDYALYSEFESREALAEYQKHPLHLAAKETFHHLIGKRYCADYEF